MANSEQFEKVYSAQEQVEDAQKQVKDYLYNRFKDKFGNGYSLRFDKAVSFERMQQVIKNTNLRHEFETQYGNRTIKPNGGVLVLRKQDDERYYKIVLIAEVKRQGTNADRAKEGKKKTSPR